MDIEPLCSTYRNVPQISLLIQWDSASTARRNVCNGFQNDRLRHAYTASTRKRWQSLQFMQRQHVPVWIPRTKKNAGKPGNTMDTCAAVAFLLFPGDWFFTSRVILFYCPDAILREICWFKCTWLQSPLLSTDVDFDHLSPKIKY